MNEKSVPFPAILANCIQQKYHFCKNFPYSICSPHSGEDTRAGGRASSGLHLKWKKRCVFALEFIGFRDLSLLLQFLRENSSLCRRNNEWKNNFKFQDLYFIRDRIKKCVHRKLVSVAQLQTLNDSIFLGAAKFFCRLADRRGRKTFFVCLNCIRLESMQNCWYKPFYPTYRVWMLKVVFLLGVFLRVSSELRDSVAASMTFSIEISIDGSFEWSTIDERWLRIARTAVVKIDEQKKKVENRNRLMNIPMKINPIYFAHFGSDTVWMG